MELVLALAIGESEGVAIDDNAALMTCHAESGGSWHVNNQRRIRVGQRKRGRAVLVVVPKDLFALKGKRVRKAVAPAKTEVAVLAGGAAAITTLPCEGEPARKSAIGEREKLFTAHHRNGVTVGGGITTALR